jgi:hypothetical protein
MNRTIALSFPIVLLVSVSACQPNGPPDLATREAEIESLRAILAGDRQAHLETDARWLVVNLADTLIDVADGAIVHEMRSDVEQSFTSYLEGAKYHA